MALRISLIFLLIIVLCSCATQEPISETRDVWANDLLENVDGNEGQSCWENICPGSTNWHEAFKTLKSNNQVLNVSREENEEFTKNNQVFWDFYTVSENLISDQGLLIIDPETKIVKEVRLIIKYSEISILEYLENYEEPATFYISNPISLTNKCYVVLIFPKTNTSVSCVSKCGSVGDTRYVEFKENDLISQITFFSKDGGEKTLENIYPWKGYGRVDLP